MNEDIDAVLEMLLDLSERIVDRVCETLGIEAYAIPDGAIDSLPIDMENYLSEADIDTLEDPELVDALVEAMAVEIAERTRVALADPEPRYGLWAGDTLIISPLTCAEAVARRAVLAEAADAADEDTAYRVYVLGEEFLLARFDGEGGPQRPRG